MIIQPLSLAYNLERNWVCRISKPQLLLVLNGYIMWDFSALLIFISVLCQVVVVDPEAYAYDDEVIKKAEAMGKPGLIEIEARQDSFIFTVETTGAIKAYQLFLNAIEILKNKLDAVRLSEDTVEADDQFGELGAHMRGG